LKDIEFHPARVLTVSFAAAILVGTVLLSLPFSASEGRTHVLDAFFTATSAVCVTGLIVKDTPAHYSPAGQTIILGLIQLGGLGIMTFSTLIILAARRRISVRERLLIQSSFHPGIPKDLPSLVRSIFVFTAAIEAAGAAALFLWFAPDFGAARALQLAVFHSVSSFCNAGFSLFSDSLVAYRGHAGINLTVAGLIILGGLGFPVLRESLAMLRARFRGRNMRASLHFKLVVTATVILILAAGVILFIVEGRFSMASLSIRERVLASFFQGVTARTAGFNTINIAALGPASVLLMLFLMFVGASPASTGGGVKTSTAGLLVLLIRARVKARETISAFHRTLSGDLVIRAFTLVALALAVIFLSSGILLANQPELGIQEALFEVFSAFGTVGLSMGVTSELTPVGKIVIILTMFIGRVGPLTLLYALSRRKARGRFEYAEESVLVG
jgi:trk system potassium uptake protein TrkH